MEGMRRPTPTVYVGRVPLGGAHPIAVQSMTNTPTRDVEATAAQVLELYRAGSEIVRLTVNDEEAAKAVPEIKRRLLDEGAEVPLVGDFHFNGHLLLRKYPRMAEALDKFRINPGTGPGAAQGRALRRDAPHRHGPGEAREDRGQLGKLRPRPPHRTHGPKREAP